MAMRRRRQAGLTLVELIVAFTILALLTTMAVPMAKYKVRRDKERELRHALLEMRTAVDKYKDLCDNKQLDNTVAGKIGSECYPETLEALVQGVKKTGAVDQKVRLLRRVPRDPFTNSREWGKRSVQDETTSTSWGGQNIFDVYTKSTEKAPDGTLYAEW
jgi:general secretion pathway protein G